LKVVLLCKLQSRGFGPASVRLVARLLPILEQYDLSCGLGKMNFRELLSTQIIEEEESKIEGVVTRWLEVSDIIGLRCHHAMFVDVIASETPIISTLDVTPS
jgi:hypothetical protein